MDVRQYKLEPLKLMDYQKIKITQNILVLNSDYSPINICDGRRAIVLLLKEKAHMITEKVIRLLNYIRIPFIKIMSHKPSRNVIYRRDGYKCQYCSSTRNLTIDHIIPKCKGGKDTYLNLVVACNSCNTKKGDKLLEQTEMKLINKPKEPKNKIEFYLWESDNKEWKEYANYIR